MKKEVEKEVKSGQNKKGNLILFSIFFLLSAAFATFFFVTPEWYIKIVCIMFFLLFILGSFAFLSSYFYKNNTFFNILLGIFITPIILMFSTLMILMYVILVPLMCLMLMALIAFSTWTALGFSLLYFGIDGNTEALFYVATLLAILIYYYFGERIHKLLNRFVYWLAANTFSHELKLKVERFITPQSSRKLLYASLFLIYVTTTIMKFSGIEHMIVLNFSNEALLTFVIWDSLVGGKNVLAFRKQSSSL